MDWLFKAGILLMMFGCWKVISNVRKQHKLDEEWWASKERQLLREDAFNRIKAARAGDALPVEFGGDIDQYRCHACSKFIQVSRDREALLAVIAAMNQRQGGTTPPVMLCRDCAEILAGEDVPRPGSGAVSTFDDVQ